MRLHSHKSEFDPERVLPLRGALPFPTSTRILLQIGSPEAPRGSWFMATHRFVEEFMVAARRRPFHLARMEIRIVLRSPEP